MSYTLLHFVSLGKPVHRRPDDALDAPREGATITHTKTRHSTLKRGRI